MKLIESRHRNEFCFTSDLYLSHNKMIKDDITVNRAHFKMPCVMDKEIIDSLDTACIDNGDSTLVVLGDFGNYNKVSEFKSPVVLITGDMEWEDMRVIHMMQCNGATYEDILKYFKSYKSSERNLKVNKIKDLAGKPWVNKDNCLSYIEHDAYSTFKKILLELGFADVIHTGHVRFLMDEKDSDLMIGLDLSHHKEVVKLGYKGFHLFGHDLKTTKCHGRGINVGVDVHDYKPLSVSDVLKYINQIVLMEEDSKR